MDEVCPNQNDFHYNNADQSVADLKLPENMNVGTSKVFSKQSV